MNWLYLGVGGVLAVFVLFMIVVIRVVLKNKGTDDTGPRAGSTNVSPTSSSVDPDRF